MEAGKESFIFFGLSSGPEAWLVSARPFGGTGWSATCGAESARVSCFAVKPSATLIMLSSVIDCDCEWARDGISGFEFFVIMHLGASAVYHASISACVSELTRSKAPEDGPRSELSVPCTYNARTWNWPFFLLP